MHKAKCPICKREFEDEKPFEQEIAIQKRGKCIHCIIDAKEPIQMEPYEFDDGTA